MKTIIKINKKALRIGVKVNREGFELICDNEKEYRQILREIMNKNGNQDLSDYLNNLCD